MRRLCRFVASTRPRSYPAVVCGHILAARVLGDVAVDGVFGSDHLGVLAELRY